MQAARNNLGLAYLADGRIESARAAFAATTDPATAAYNLGIAQMAGRRYGDAVTAFTAAQQARPNWHLAALRAEQAERLSQAGTEE
jgi:Flp pilus assembly protein TadD